MHVDKKRIKADVYDMLSEQFSIARQEISDSLGPGDLAGWDSIGHLQLVRKLERHFHISFTVYDIMSLNTVKDICDTIQSRFS